MEDLFLLAGLTALITRGESSFGIASCLVRAGACVMLVYPCSPAATYVTDVTLLVNG
jgi:hypothetical protein